MPGILRALASDRGGQMRFGDSARFAFGGSGSRDRDRGFCVLLSTGKLITKTVKTRLLHIGREEERGLRLWEEMETTRVEEQD